MPRGLSPFLTPMHRFPAGEAATKLKTGFDRSKLLHVAKDIRRPFLAALVAFDHAIDKSHSPDTLGY